MGGSGVIDLDKLYDHKHTFGICAKQLAYPDKLTFAAMQLDDEINPTIGKLLQSFWDQMQLLSLDEIEELYVQTFDFQKSTTLYMTHAKFEDSRERGQMLANLKAIYEMYGLEISDGELSDYLPLICEFLYAADWRKHEHAEESMGLLTAVLEDGTYELLKALQKMDSPYYGSVKALRETLKLCLRQEVDANEHD
jgi:nitrate reductase delta subunit